MTTLTAPTENDLRELGKTIDVNYGLVEFSIAENFGSWQDGYPLIGHTITLSHWKNGLNHCIDNRGHRVKFKYNPKTIKNQLKKYSYTIR